MKILKKKKKHFNHVKYGYTSQQHKQNTYRKWRKDDRRRDRGVNFVCHSCGIGFRAFPKCRIKNVYCGECGSLMDRFRGFFCDIRPNLKKCDGCGCCDTGTDADFDRYAVQVQNGEGYYDDAGTFHYYDNWRD